MREEVSGEDAGKQTFGCEPVRQVGADQTLHRLS